MNTANSLMNTYARLPVTFASGQGAWLTDTNGNRYLDAVSGIAVCSLGHAHPNVSKAICDQANRLVHTSNLYGIANQEQLAQKLTEASGMERVFFCNSGAEANEAAIKIARKYGHEKGVAAGKIIVMENSFHGRTLATLSATGNAKIHDGFTPLVEGFVRVPFNNIDAVKAHSKDTDIVAVLVEPIQGEGGVHVPDPNYLTQLRALCDEHGWLLMLDEIQTGVGRTGKWFAFQHEDIQPDVLTLAKALGNGVPIGACLAKGKAAETFVPGNHGTTFGGNPLACAAGLAVMDTLSEDRLVPKVAQQGKTLLSTFSEALASNPHVINIRGKGLMIGIQLDRPCGELVKLAIDKGLLINVTRGDTIRLLPPFVMNNEELGALAQQVITLVNDFTHYFKK